MFLSVVMIWIVVYVLIILLMSATIFAGMKLIKAIKNFDKKEKL